MKKAGFILGTPFCGSTLLGNYLNHVNDCIFLGEVDRLRNFSRWPNDPEYYEDGCFICGTHEVDNCPVWSGVIEAPNEDRRLGSIYQDFISKFDQNLIIDGSKTADWLADLVGSGLSIPVFGIVCVRLPFSFCVSNHGATNWPIHRSAEMWRDIYFHIIRVLTGRNIPFVVVRYEDFSVEPNKSLHNILSMLNYRHEIDFSNFYDTEVHPIGGNSSAYCSYPNFSSDGWLKKFPEDKEKMAYWKEKGRSVSVESRWMRDLTDLDLSTIIHTPGLSDLASLLGYDLTAFLKMKYSTGNN